MKRIFLLLLIPLALAPTLCAQAAPANEYIVVSGGPSLIEWEKFKKIPHDHWWANFVRAARIRLGELREQRGDDALITWMVYKPGYERRGTRQEKQNLISNIASVQQKYKLNLVYFGNKQQFLDYINGGTKQHPRDTWKIANFEYFGHSNRACFMFDYSNEIDSASKTWLHEKELNLINQFAFAPRAFIKSWGCHTGESMSALWRKATGQRMIGAVGTTDYSGSDDPGWHPKLGSSGGRWIR